MDKLARVLKVWLKRMPYELFLSGSLDCMNIERKLLQEAVHTSLPHYSDTEIRHMLEGLSDSLDRYAEFRGYRRKDEVHSFSVFDAVFPFADTMLVIKNNEVLCRYEKILRWRVTTIDISEEIFITAFLAKNDLEDGRMREYFSWPTVISHNNVQLKKITGKGMAENHFHLWGSVPYFHMSWLQLMNHISDTGFSRQVSELETNLRTGYTIYDHRWTAENMRTSCYKAALIRLYLYGRLTDTRFELGKYYISWEYFRPWIRSLDGRIDWETLEHILNKNQSDFAVLKDIFGVVYKKKPEKMEVIKHRIQALERILEKKLDFPERKTKHGDISIQEILEHIFQKQDRIRLAGACYFFSVNEFFSLWWDVTFDRVYYLLKNEEMLERQIDQVQSIIDSMKIELSSDIDDYALLAHDFKFHKNQELYYNLSGERHLLYEMFRRILKQDKSLQPHVYNMFYAYLLIKERVRGELIQSNGWVGFENFEIYQNRKSYFSGGPKYDRLLAQIAVLSCLQQDVKLLEARITPKNTAAEYYKNIQFLDNAIDREKKLRHRFFYVVHFIKRTDKWSGMDKFCECRHSAARRDYKQKARALIDFRRNYKQAATRILGIDAASQEIGCRPEVFGEVFRTLQQDTQVTYSMNGTVRMPQLRVTYHVGEDFLDPADGLRAIDEAILFLNLDCGDRLGHALALGISVQEWYEEKRWHISLPMQDYLDNLVWLYHNIVRYQICGMDNLKNFIEAEYQKCFSEIYGQYMRKDYIDRILETSEQQGYQGNLNFDINAYYDAWKIRGDNPELYQMGFFKEPSGCFSAFELNGVNYHYPPDFEIRYKPEVGIIYHFYHFNSDVRHAGRREKDFKVNENYIKGVALVQKAMQREIAARGIAIETNPSSNYMIGTFKLYEEHPITKFYNNELTHRHEELEECAQLWTSINTDDQGVFGTMLQNEYALMARALERKKDKNGQLLYAKTMIYEWLDKIREMGIRQSFYYQNSEDESLNIGKE